MPNNTIEIVLAVFAVLAIVAYIFSIVILTLDEVVARSTSLSIAFGRRR